MKPENPIPGFLKPMAPVPTDLKHGGSLRKPLACIMFDVYGTLFISGTGDISIARKMMDTSGEFQKLLLNHGISIPPDQLLQAFFDAIQDSHEASRKKGVDFPEVSIDRIWSKVLGNKNMADVRRFAIAFELLANPVYPMPHLKSVLSACRKAGVLMGIISNAQFYTPYLFQWFLASDLEGLGFSRDLLFMSYQIGYAKPSPHIFAIATDKMNSLGISASSALYLGNDMRNDIYPAKKAGFQTALFAGDARSLRLRPDDPACKSLSADLVITDLRQILDYLPQ